MVDKNDDDQQVKNQDFVNILTQLIKEIKSGSPIPFAFKDAEPGPEGTALMQDINDRLMGLKPTPDSYCITPVSVAFPHCADVLLADVKLQAKADDITGYFDDYFMFCDHRIIVDNSKLDGVLDQTLLTCTDKYKSDPTCPTGEIILESRRPMSSASSAQDLNCSPYSPGGTHGWPPPWCMPPSCVTLAGKRHLYKNQGVLDDLWIRRLFIGDLVWLFYFERMGILKILGVILDDFATKGSIPISNGSVNASIPDIKDDIIALILESMVRETKTGLSSTVRDRSSTYRRCLGWNSDVGKKMDLDSVVNHAFSTHFHKFITLSLEFYKDKRLAQAIQGVAGPSGKTSVSTLTTISNTIELLKKAFDPFDYGRNYSNTLNGIIWVIAGMALIRELRTSLGIPEAYENPYEYIPAAYDLLVTKGPITPSETNRYISHQECAGYARDILLDLEVINYKQTGVGEELELWLTIIEKSVEGYRSAYRALTGVDLGAPQTSGIGPIEQEA